MSSEATVAPPEGARPLARLLRSVRLELSDPERRTAYVLALPVAIVIIAIAIYPLINVIVLSFNDVRPNGVSLGFVGLQNYVYMFQDADFRAGVFNTVVFTAVTVFFEFGLGMAIALGLNREFFGRSAARAIALLPWAFPTVVSATMWRLMFSDQVGIINYVATQLHLISAPILSNNGEMLVGLILVDIWKTTPFTAILLLAGLQTIPADVYEACSIDGAGRIRTFVSITLPLLRPAIMVALLFRTLDAWRAYDVFWVLTDRQLPSISTYVYQTVRLSQINFPVGNAAAVFVFVSSLVIALAFVRLLGTRVRSGAGAGV